MTPLDSTQTFGPAWRRAWSELGFAAPSAPVLAELLARWGEPHRRYHTLQHLDECLAQCASNRALAEHPGEVAIAVWFHDAVYDTSRHDNEAESAAWAVRVLREAGAPGEAAARVEALVMATRHSVPARTADERLVVDIDLAILGASPARFDEYDRQIRDEYGFVPEAVFREKRAQVLRGFLDRPAIFGTAAFVQRFEAQARVNLARALAGLA